jgi:hypothetical protein
MVRVSFKYGYGGWEIFINGNMVDQGHCFSIDECVKWVTQYTGKQVIIEGFAV